MGAAMSVSYPGGDSPVAELPAETTVDADVIRLLSKV